MFSQPAKPACKCTKQMMPVCGQDGKNYNNQVWPCAVSLDLTIASLSRSAFGGCNDDVAMDQVTCARPCDLRVFLHCSVWLSAQAPRSKARASVLSIVLSPTSPFAVPMERRKCFSMHWVTQLLLFPGPLHKSAQIFSSHNTLGMHSQVCQRLRCQGRRCGYHLQGRVPVYETGLSPTLLGDFTYARRHDVVLPGVWRRIPATGVVYSSAGTSFLLCSWG